MFGFPGESSTCACKVIQWTSYVGKVWDEAAIEINEAKNERTSLMVRGVGQPDMAFVFSEDGATPLEQYLKPK